MDGREELARQWGLWVLKLPLPPATPSASGLAFGLVSSGLLRRASLRSAPRRAIIDQRRVQANPGVIQLDSTELYTLYRLAMEYSGVRFSDQGQTRLLLRLHSRRRRIS
jgi:hypothetical protein